MMPRWLWALLASLLIALWWAGRPVASIPAGLQKAGTTSPACPSAPTSPDAAEPLQSAIAGVPSPFRVGVATVSPLAGFSVQARVLSRENYSMGREADFSPTDLALGWGPMAAPGIADALSVSQGGRWYRYRWGADGPPIPAAVIARNSANMHIVPGTPEVARALARIGVGDKVRINGWLVDIRDDGGWQWRSSLSRDDTGNGACELVLVCSLQSE